MGLFQLGEFVGASGLTLPYKIECDKLTRSDWRCIAEVAHSHLPAFGQAKGVPRGGTLLGELLNVHRTPKSRTVLIVDDVWTTGKSLKEFAEEYVKRHHWCDDWIGFVAFARGPLPVRVRCFAQVMI